MTLAGQGELPRRSFTVGEVLRMVSVGILHESEPLELVDGELVVMSPQGFAHVFVATLLRQRLLALFREDAFTLFEEKPLQIDEHNLPEPDLALVRGALPGFARLGRFPRGDEALLVVEVSQSSQAWDRKKARLYARAGVPVYWLVDLVARRIEVYSQPDAEGRYQNIQLVSEDQEIEVPEIGVRWRGDALLPPQEG